MDNKKYLEVSIETNTEGTDIISALLFDYGADGVNIIDNLSNPQLGNSQLSIVNNQSSPVTVIGYFTSSVDLKEIKKELKQYSGLGSLKITVTEKPEQDWTKVWRSFYKPQKIGQLIIKPEWEEYTPSADEVIFIMEPGQAFGTGEHESTRMCLEFLSGLDIKNKTVFDIGCGSGILGISAVLLGAESAVLSDIDPKAVAVAKYNAELNNAAGKTEVICCDLFSDSGPVLPSSYFSEGKPDIIFANITADVLIRLSFRIKSLMKENTKVVLSGIIDGRTDDVKNAFAEKGIILSENKKQGAWNAFLACNNVKK